MERRDRALAAPDENLAVRPGVSIDVSGPVPQGAGSRDPRVLLNETAHRLHGRPLAAFDRGATYDTFDGWNEADGPDWYAITFPAPVPCNCVEMTMGLPYRDGGWWTTLAVETRTSLAAPWVPVANLTITPAYSFADRRGERRPFTTHVLTFDAVVAQAVRVIGRPGGLAQFTSLARLAIYQRDLSHWNPLDQNEPPLPHLFQLIPPSMVWHLSESLTKLSGLTVELPMMEYYLDEPHFQRLWHDRSRNYRGEPELWFLVGQAMGWDAWNRMTTLPRNPQGEQPGDPYVHTIFHDTLGQARAPIVVDGKMVGEMTTQRVILDDAFDHVWHRRWAQQHGIPWPDYQAAIDRSPHKTRAQMEGAATLLGAIANTVANLVHHLDRARDVVNQRSQWRRDVVRQAIDIMEDKLEHPVTVAEVARAVNLSPPYFCALFVEQTGLTPSEYLINLRIARAQEYLSHSTLSVTDVCAALGYDPSYFSRLFKRRTGYAPGAWARLHRHHP